ncbi:MAG: type II toxin-antitoxin system prevent-host-death family antitoxin [Actinobacteria bacterium]|nr:type II toxin-antitoxin system prevent-host-death family antitoxin [Actinomycetota bacterium]
MDIAVSDMRANLATHLGAVRDGAEVVITDRGLPVARLVAVDSASTIERLTQQGVIRRPSVPNRPTAVGRVLPKSRQPVSDIVGDQRR